MSAIYNIIGKLSQDSIDDGTTLSILHLYRKLYWCEHRLKQRKQETDELYHEVRKLRFARQNMFLDDSEIDEMDYSTDTDFDEESP